VWVVQRAQKSKSRGGCCAAAYKPSLHGLTWRSSAPIANFRLFLRYYFDAQDSSGESLVCSAKTERIN